MKRKVEVLRVSHPGDLRKKSKIHRRLKQKHGVCHHYTNAKTRYERRAVAEFDATVLGKRFPQFTFSVFRCEHCGKHHVGRAMENGEYVVANVDD